MLSVTHVGPPVMGFPWEAEWSTDPIQKNLEQSQVVISPSGSEKTIPDWSIQIEDVEKNLLSHFQTGCNWLLHGHVWTIVSSIVCNAYTCFRMRMTWNYFQLLMNTRMYFFCTLLSVTAKDWCACRILMLDQANRSSIRPVAECGGLHRTLAIWR